MKSRRIYAASIAAVLAATSTSIVAFAEASAATLGDVKLGATKLEATDGVYTTTSEDAADLTIALTGEDLIAAKDSYDENDENKYAVTADNAGTFADGKVTIEDFTASKSETTITITCKKVIAKTETNEEETTYVLSDDEGDRQTITVKVQLVDDNNSGGEGESGNEENVATATVTFTINNQSDVTFTHLAYWGVDENPTNFAAITNNAVSVTIPTSKLGDFGGQLRTNSGEWIDTTKGTVDITLPDDVKTELAEGGTKSLTITIGAEPNNEGKYTVTFGEGSVVTPPESGDESSTPEDSDPTSSDPTSSEPTSTPSSGTTTRPSTSTSTPSTSTNKPATVPAVNTKVEAEVKPGETATVKSDDLGGDVTVAIDAEDTALEGAKLEIEATNNKTTTTNLLNETVGTNASSEVKALVEAAVKAVEDGNAVTFDISFTKDGSDVQPGKAVTITAPVPAALKGADKLFVYHVTDKGLENVTDKCSYDKAKGTIAITNDTFSPYIISKVEIKASNANTGDENTGKPNPSTGIALAIAPVVIAGAAVAIVSAKKRK